MRECILHIGMRKTGSTSIQQSLGSAANLQGVRYVRFGARLNASNPLENAFAADTRGNKKRNPGAAAAAQAHRVTLVKRLQEALTEPGASRFLISGERLHRLEVDELRELREALLKHVDQIRVVAYVRDVPGFVNSLFQQHVKTGGLLSLGELDRAMPNYRDTFERFDQAFGAEQMSLWHFDPAHFVRGNVVLDFCHRIDASIADEDAQYANEALSRDALGLLHAWRHLVAPRNFTLTQKLQLSALAPALATLQGNKLKLDPALLAKAMQTHRDDITWMEQRLGTSLSTLPRVVPDAVRSDEDLMLPTPAAIAWLGQQLGRPLDLAPTAPDAAQRSAKLVDELCALLAPASEESAQRYLKLQKTLRKSARDLALAKEEGTEESAAKAAKLKERVSKLRRKAKTEKEQNGQERNGMLIQVAGESEKIKTNKKSAREKAAGKAAGNAKSKPGKQAGKQTGKPVKSGKLGDSTKSGKSANSTKPAKSDKPSRTPEQKAAAKAKRQLAASQDAEQ